MRNTSAASWSNHRYLSCRFFQNRRDPNVLSWNNAIPLFYSGFLVRFVWGVLVLPSSHPPPSSFLCTRSSPLLCLPTDPCLVSSTFLVSFPSRRRIMVRASSIEPARPQKSDPEQPFVRPNRVERKTRQRKTIIFVGETTLFEGRSGDIVKFGYCDTVVSSEYKKKWEKFQRLQKEGDGHPEGMGVQGPGFYHRRLPRTP